MNKDRVEGKVKDVAGRVERQAGEWTGDQKIQIRGAAKQAKGKIQNAVGKVKRRRKSGIGTSRGLRRNSSGRHRPSSVILSSALNIGWGNHRISHRTAEISAFSAGLGEIHFGDTTIGITTTGIS